MRRRKNLAARGPTALCRTKSLGALVRNGACRVKLSSNRRGSLPSGIEGWSVARVIEIAIAVPVDVAVGIEVFASNCTDARMLGLPARP
jgi:hypothetical protein